MTDRLTMTVDYDALHRTFLEDAQHGIDDLLVAARPVYVAGGRVSTAYVTDLSARVAVESLAAAHQVLIGVCIALGAASSVEQVEACRTLLQEVTSRTSTELSHRRDYVDYVRECLDNGTQPTPMEEFLTQEYGALTP